MKMETNTHDLLPLSCRAAVGSVNDQARTVEVIFTTGAAVERMDWMNGKRFLEKLSLEPSAVRLGRLNTGAPLLDAHGAYSLADQIGGVVEGSARIAGNEGRATIRFSRRSEVEPIWQDVRDGIIRNVSVGYRVHKFEESTEKALSLPVRTAVDWEPFEISLVPMGADAGARVRGHHVATNPCVIAMRNVDGGAATMSREDADRIRRFRLAKAQTI
jgi:hypothetical protein